MTSKIPLKNRGSQRESVLLVKIEKVTIKIKWQSFSVVIQECQIEILVYDAKNEVIVKWKN